MPVLQENCEQLMSRFIEVLADRSAHRVLQPPPIVDVSGLDQMVVGVIAEVANVRATVRGWHA